MAAAGVPSVCAVSMALMSATSESKATSRVPMNWSWMPTTRSVISSSLVWWHVMQEELTASSGDWMWWLVTLRAPSVS